MPDEARRWRWERREKFAGRGGLVRGGRLGVAKLIVREESGLAWVGVVGGGGCATRRYAVVKSEN